VNSHKFSDVSFLNSNDNKKYPEIQKNIELIIKK
jgi:hypothetical protein